MAHKWASLVADSSDDENFACAWAPTETSAESKSHAGGWAGVTNDEPSHASSWAPLVDHTTDDADAADEHMELADVAHDLTSYNDLVTAIATIDGKTTLRQIQHHIRQITTLTKVAITPTDIGDVAMLYHAVLQKIADNGARDDFLDGTFESKPMSSFAKEQLATTEGGTDFRHIESKSAEQKRLGCGHGRTDATRELMSVGVWALQRSCANAFLEDLCNRAEKVNGVASLYLEKHRGDETPFTRVSANDLVNDGPDNMIDGVEKPKDLAIPCDEILAREQQKHTAESKLEARSTTTNLKVYQTDVEIGALFGQELLTTFKLITPLSRTDRCTGVCYNWLHQWQSHILPVRSRFMRYQRLHTSDGDKAQDLAERILHHERSTADPKCAVPTLRSRCIVHRVYHVMTTGMTLLLSLHQFPNKACA